MSTMIETPPAVKPTLPTLLTIKGLEYSASPISPVEEGTAAYRLDKRSGDQARYDVVRTHDGLVVCDCPDYECRKAGTSALCKHGQALVEAGLLEAPCPVPNKPAVAPISAKDRQRAAMWGLKLPAVPVPVALVEIRPPVVVEVAPEIVEPSNPRDGWPDWTDADFWEITPEPSESVSTTRPTYLPHYEPSEGDDLERLGLELTLAGEDARPPAGLSFYLLTRFFEGVIQGERMEDEAVEAWVRDRERMEDAFGDPLDRLHPAEQVEAGFRSGHPAFEG